MKTYLKYFLLFVVFAVLWNGEGGNMCPERDAADVAKEVRSEICQTIISDTDFVPCLPRQVSFSNTVSVHHNARRPGSICRSNIECIKAGKVVNAGITYIQNIYVITRSSLSEPVRKLIRMGKLII